MKTEVVRFRTTTEMKAALEAQAEAENKTVSSLITIILQDHLKWIDNEKKRKIAIKEYYTK